MNKEYTKTLYKEVVDITYDYLGPAADRFVTRQIRNHLEKDPENLNKSDLNDLIAWIRLAMNILSDDQMIIDQYIDKLKSLTR
jgi:hypothetical protein